MKMGQKITMISVHSSGQPSRKMINWAMIRKPTGERFMPSTHLSINAWPPCSANTAEKSAEPMKSQQTIAVVFAVRETDSLMFCQSSGEVRTCQNQGTSVPAKVAPRDAETNKVTKPPRGEPRA